MNIKSTDTNFSITLTDLEIRAIIEKAIFQELKSKDFVLEIEFNCNAVATVLKKRGRLDLIASQYLTLTEHEESLAAEIYIAGLCIKGLRAKKSYQEWAKHIKAGGELYYTAWLDYEYPWRWTLTLKEEDELKAKGIRNFKDHVFRNIDGVWFYRALGPEVKL